jgi:hypothetical protein
VDESPKLRASFDDFFHVGGRFARVNLDGGKWCKLSVVSSSVRCCGPAACRLVLEMHHCAPPPVPPARKPCPLQYSPTPYKLAIDADPWNEKVKLRVNERLKRWLAIMCATVSEKSEGM